MFWCCWKKPGCGAEGFGWALPWGMILGKSCLTQRLLEEAWRAPGMDSAWCMVGRAVGTAPVFAGVECT